MTTSQRLWLGFGTLTALLVLSSVALIVRVRSIEGQVGEMATIARSRSAAARQLEINVLGYSLAVRAHFQSDNPKAQQDAVKEAANVERHLKEYERLATNDRQHEMAARFAPLWQELKKLGQALLDAETRQLKLDDSERFYGLRTGLEKLLDDEMQVEAIETYNVRRDAALHDVRTIVGFALILLIVGVVIAVVTSVAVGRAVVSRERVFAEQGERLRTTLASIGDAVITTDIGGRITNLNAVAESLTGWTTGEAAGQPLDAVFRIVNEQTRQPVENPATRAFREGIIVGLANHTVLIAKDGTERPIDDSAAPIRCKEGEVVGCVLVFRDLTERKQTEDTEGESRRRLRLIMDSMPQKTFTARPNGDVDYFNPQWTEFTGLSFEHIRDWGWTQFIHPDDVAENVRVWRQSIDTGEPFHFEHRFRRADGEYRWHLSRAVLLRDADGKAVMWVGSNTDVHEQRETANQLRQYAADLSEADRRKNEFLAMLAHELRTPLAPIRNAVQILRLTASRGRESPEDEARHSASEIMERQVGHIVRLVDDLLDVSRISRGAIELRKGRVELASVVNHAVEAVRPLCNSMNHELTVTLPPQPIYLNGDPTRLVQVVGNLLNNAYKFTDKRGRISLTVEVEEVRRQEAARAVIRVRDSGIGIAPDQLPRIFDMFMQGDPTLERSGSGLGIGLTLVKNLVEAHDGTVEVHSAGTGHGSEFVVRLPILVETRKPPPPEPTVSEPPGTTARRILVVDDNRDSTESLAMWLELTGNETLRAYDGLEAIEAAATFRPEVVLLDIGLPKLNGYEVCRRIRDQAWGKNMVLVALTGWGQDEDRQKSSAAGFNGHLVKPVDHAALTKLLAETGPDA